MLFVFSFDCIFQKVAYVFSILMLLVAMFGVRDAFLVEDLEMDAPHGPEHEHDGMTQTIEQIRHEFFINYKYCWRFCWNFQYHSCLPMT